MVKPSSNASILLVEDQDAVRELCEKVLEMGGFRVATAHDGSEALKVFKDADVPYDLLLTDVAMPKMTGMQLVKELRLIHPDLKVVFMSGYASYSETDIGTPDQETSFILKPFSPDALIQKVREALDS